MNSNNLKYKCELDSRPEGSVISQFKYFVSQIFIFIKII